MALVSEAAQALAVGRLEGLRGWIQAVAFSPDGNLVAAGDLSGDNRRLLIWDVGSGRRTVFESDFPPNQLTFSPDGLLLAGAGPRARRRSGRRCEREARGAAACSTSWPAPCRFRPTAGSRVVGWIAAPETSLSTEDWKPAGPGIRGHGQRILNPRFMPDGRTLATSSAEGTVQLWDVASRRSIGGPLAVQRDVYVALVMSRDGPDLYALPTGTEGMRLALIPRLWHALACAIAGRELTRREWDEVLPDRPYREVCAPA